MERPGRNLLIRLTRPQVRLHPGEGQGRGAAKGGGEAGVSDLAGDARGAEEVAEADEARSPRRVLGGSISAGLLLAVLRLSRLCSFLCLFTYLPHTRSQLPSDF